MAWVGVYIHAVLRIYRNARTGTMKDEPDLQFGQALLRFFLVSLPVAKLDSLLLVRLARVLAHVSLVFEFLFVLFLGIALYSRQEFTSSSGPLSAALATLVIPLLPWSLWSAYRLGTQHRVDATP
jgi:hypothetical protein